MRLLVLCVCVDETASVVFVWMRLLVLCVCVDETASVVCMCG